MKLINRLEKSRSFWFLLFLTFAFFVLRLPSLFEPYWYGDEGIYQSLGLLIRDGQALYSGAWDNKPPLLYFLYAILNSEQFAIRLTSLVFGLLTVVVFHLTALKLFKKRSSAFVSTTLFAILFGTPFIEGNIANAENFMMLPIVLGAYIILSFEDIKKYKPRNLLFLGGFLLSLAFLTKIVAGFDFLAFFVFLLIADGNLRKNIREKILPFSLGFFIPVIVTSGYYFITNNFKDYADAFIFSNIGYVGYGNKFIIPQGLLIFKALLLTAFIAFLNFRKTNIPKASLFILIWFGFSLYNAFFSQRPYTHYLLTLLPAFCLMLGVVIDNAKQRAFLLLIFLIGALLVYKNFKFYEKITPYYINMFSFCKSKSVADYQAFFDRNTPRDYEIAYYINNKTNDKDRIFIWGNNAQLYKLTNKPPLLRYTVAYHITNYKTGISEMQTAIDTKKPKYVVIMPNVPAFPGSLINYQESMDIHGVKIYERIF